MGGGGWEEEGGRRRVGGGGWEEEGARRVGGAWKEDYGEGMRRVGEREEYVHLPSIAAPFLLPRQGLSCGST